MALHIMLEPCYPSLCDEPSWVQWLLSNVLTTTIALIMKLFIEMVQALDGTKTLEQFDFELFCFQKIVNKKL